MSNTIRIALVDATVDNLRWFASAKRGIPVEQKWNSNTLRAKIAETGYTDDHIDVPSDSVQAKTIVPPRVDATSPAGSDDDRLVRIKINKEANVPGGMDHVFVSVNAKAIYIPRGEVVKVKAKYARALRDAVYRDYQPLLDEQGKLIPDRGAIDDGQDADRFPVSYYDPLDPLEEAA